jgi:hypothetical protein
LQQFLYFNPQPKISLPVGHGNYYSAVIRDGRWSVDAYRGDGRGYIVRSDELPIAFLELESTLL